MDTRRNPPLLPMVDTKTNFSKGEPTYLEKHVLCNAAKVYCQARGKISRGQEGREQDGTKSKKLTNKEKGQSAFSIY